MSDTAMIAYLPVDGSWCKQDLPHMTLVYAGPISDLQESDLNVLGKDAVSAARITGAFSLPVTAVEKMGEGIEAVDALVLYPNPQLLLARNLVEKWNKSEYKDFKPHATIGPVGSAFVDDVNYNNTAGSTYYRRQSLPDRLYFDRIAVCWGDKKLVFNTNSY